MGKKYIPPARTGKLKCTYSFLAAAAPTAFPAEPRDKIVSDLFLVEKCGGLQDTKNHLLSSLPSKSHRRSYDKIKGGN